MTFALAFVALFHLLVFVAEVLLWMEPAVYGIAISKLSSETTLDAYQQALVLRPLFINQGFYNLFLAGAACAALALLRAQRREAGHALAVYALGSACAAGVVLALSTRAYVGAALQAGPAALGLLLSRRSRTESKAGD